MPVYNNLSEIDWFEWNGVLCTDFGIHVLAQPQISSPKERVSTVTVPGRSGSLMYIEAENIYEDQSLSCNCIIDNLDDDILHEIVSYLRGSGKVKFANRSDGYFKGRIVNQIPFAKVLPNHPHMTFSVEFQVNPFLYLDNGEIKRTLTKGVGDASVQEIFNNTGNIESLPIIKITRDPQSSGDGIVTLSITSQGSGSTSIVVSGLNETEYTVLDSDAKLAFKGERGNSEDPLILLGKRVSGDWPIFPTGRHYLVASGDFATVEVTPRWRCV